MRLPVTHLQHCVRGLAVEQPEGGFGSGKLLEGLGWGGIEAQHDVVPVNNRPRARAKQPAGVAHCCASLELVLGVLEQCVVQRQTLGEARAAELPLLL